MGAAKMKREQDESCSLNHATFHPSPTSDTRRKRQLLAPDESNSGSAEAQLLLEQLTCIVAQNPPADHSVRSSLTDPNTVFRGREIGVNFPSAGKTQSSDFPPRIDGATGH